MSRPVCDGATVSAASAGCTVSWAEDVTGITRTLAHIAPGVAARLPSSAPEPRFWLFFCVAATFDSPADIPDVVSLLFSAAGMSRLTFARLHAGLRLSLSGGSAGLAGLAVCSVGAQDLDITMVT
jgi:hypothetical protein